MDGEMLMTEMDTNLLLKIIQSFPEKYEMFKIVDDSCANFYPKKLTKEEETEVFERYGADMRCTNPKEHRGGLKNWKKIKIKNKKSKRKRRKNMRFY